MLAVSLSLIWTSSWWTEKRKISIRRLCVLKFPRDFLRTIRQTVCMRRSRIPWYESKIQRHLKGNIKAASLIGRAKYVQDEIQFVLDHEDVCDSYSVNCWQKVRSSACDPQRYKAEQCYDRQSDWKGICVIDLDTVMPGLAMHDFGDSIRFGASTAEDEQDLSKVSCDMDLFDTYVKGYLRGCGGKLTN